MNHRKGYLTVAEAMRSKAAGVSGAKLDENCRCGLVHVDLPAEGPDPDRNSGPSDAVRALVLRRDGYCCVCCGRSIMGQRYSLAHRLRASKQGKPVASNLITLLGWGGEQCHGRVDNREDPSDEAKGYSIRSGGNPLLVPVMIFSPHGSSAMVWLSDDSDQYLTDEPEGIAA